MQTYTIYIGNSRKEKRWKPQELTWADIVARLSQTVRTSESVSEYKSYAKSIQDDIKDVGGFVGGSLRDGVRKASHIIDRTLITLDMDYATPDTWSIIDLLHSFTCCVYSTHKHTSVHPRLRLVIPLARPVTPDEYQAVSRKIAADIGMEVFDPTTFDASRLMYWPSTSLDGEFFFQQKGGHVLNPDVVLSTYTDWTDQTRWPTSAREDKLVKKAMGSSQQDPLTKSGVIGAFCRAYTIDACIEAHLNSVYRKSAIPDRYDYVSGSTTGGAVVYDNKWLYSHHATDPAGGRLLNAYDLVRVCLFGSLDIDGTDKASAKAMTDWALQQDAVKQQLIEDKLEIAAERFAEAANDDTVRDWLLCLNLTNTGSIANDLHNYVTILLNDPALAGIRYNEFSGRLTAHSTPWDRRNDSDWTDSDKASLNVYINDKYHIYSPDKLTVALSHIMAVNKYHPIKDMLKALPPWDGVPRLDTLFIDYLGAENTSYVREVTRKTFVAAIARVMRPGVKHDEMLVLVGPQGCGKSTLIAKMGGAWFSDSLQLPDMRDKAGPEKLKGVWLMEISELAGLKKMDLEVVKSFVSRQDDQYRAPYGETVERHPRQGLIFGTTNNEHGFLRDITGNRRFWPVAVSGNGTKKAWHMSADTVARLWAEALYYYDQDEPLTLSYEVAQQAIAIQAAHIEQDERAGLVQMYLETPIPETWDKLSLGERRLYLSTHNDESPVEDGFYVRDKVSNIEIWCECFDKEASKFSKQDAWELRQMMAGIKGWKKNDKGVYRTSLYGAVRGYERDTSVGDKTTATQKEVTE